MNSSIRCSCNFFGLDYFCNSYAIASRVVLIRKPLKVKLSLRCVQSLPPSAGSSFSKVAMRISSSALPKGWFFVAIIFRLRACFSVQFPEGVEALSFRFDG